MGSNEQSAEEPGQANDRVVEQLIELENAWRIFDGLAPDTAIPGELAAVFLGVSDRTLKRLRGRGDGPPYVQYPESGSVRRNQRVLYILSDLRKWREHKRVTSTIEAATARGLTFTTRDSVFHDEHPFWAQRILDGEPVMGAPEGATLLILGHALCVPEDSSRELLAAALDVEPKVALVHLTLAEALDQAWDRSVDRLPFHRAYLAALLHESLLAVSRQEAIEFAEIPADRAGGGRDSDGSGSGSGSDGGRSSGPSPRRRRPGGGL
ncbi:helix-turn-helix domain-containing protein [Burkholderia vietnamiensis]|uniref:Uncharacterized protein n=1 Tax=Burkholderia vietnamiensis (strain G4 / LMG 22486) TaxID=269482 RepID=A4JFW5_BURVG|nr:hypothetical protein Bcep1808_2166 [Burkholderia vietnamiensis G4]MCB4344922.1 helix-turn-helix domain-containing protein [Burkholderia vietnamiensis]